MVISDSVSIPDTQAMTVPVRAIVLDCSTGRTASYLDLLGIEREEITPQTLIGRARSESDASKDGRGCLVLSGEDVALLARISEREGLTLNQVVTQFSSIIIHNVPLDPSVLRAIENILGGGKLSLEEFASDSKRYHVRADRGICGPLSGLVFGPIDRSVDRGLSVSCLDGAVELLIEIDGKGLLAQIRVGSRTVFILTTSEIADLSETTRKQIDFRTCFSRTVPFLIALRAASGESCLSQKYWANIIIDDPPLWPRYGHVDLNRLAEVTVSLGCACTIAMIPWNYRRSKQRIADLFKNQSPGLGICYHGCNHTKAEFGSQDVQRLTYLASEARRRMDLHEQTTGLTCQPVMVFPQGVFSVEAMRSLRTAGYLAAINTEIQDYQQDVAICRCDLMRPALMAYDEFPLFSRRDPKDGIINFAIDAFLGKPCLVVLHHDFFKRGFGPFEDLVQGISGIHSNLVWRNVETIVLECLPDDLFLGEQKGPSGLRSRAEESTNLSLSRESWSQRLRTAARRYACDLRDNYLSRFRWS